VRDTGEVAGDRWRLPGAQRVCRIQCRDEQGPLWAARFHRLL